MESLWQAIAIIMAVSFVSLGLRPGAVVALAIPLSLAIIFVAMQFVGIDLQRISLGALIIALGLLVDDAMTTDRRDDHAAGARRQQGAGRHLRLHRPRFPMLTGTLVTIAGFVPIGFAAQRGRRIHLLDLRGGRDRADRLLVRRGPLRAAARRLDPRSRQGGGTPTEPGPIMRMFRRFLVLAMRVRWVTIARDARPVRRGALAACRFVPRQFFPSSDRPELLVDLHLAAERLDLRHRGIVSTRLDGCSRAIRTSSTGAPMSGAARSASICRSTCSSPTTSSRRPWSSPRTLRRASGCRRSSRRRWRASFRASSRASSRSSSGRRSAGRCNTGCSGRSRTRCARSRSSVARCDRRPTPAPQNVNFDWMEPARMVSIVIDQDQARLAGPEFAGPGRRR